MSFTAEQKHQRREARAYGSAAAEYAQASPSRDLLPSYVRITRAREWAKWAAHYAFQAHHELREVGQGMEEKA